MSWYQGVIRSQALMVGLALLGNRFQRAPSPFLYVRTQQEGLAMNQEEARTRPDHAGALISDFQPPEL